MRRQCCALGGHHKSLPGLAMERQVLGLPWEMPYAQRKTQLICVNLRILPTWILTLSFSSSQAVAGVRHHLVALEAAATATRCTNVRQPDRVRYESRAPRFAIGVYSLCLWHLLYLQGGGIKSVPTLSTSLLFPHWSTSPSATHGRVLWGQGFGFFYRVGLCMDIPGLLRPYHAAAKGIPWYLTNL